MRCCRACPGTPEGQQRRAVRGHPKGSRGGRPASWPRGCWLGPVLSPYTLQGAGGHGGRREALSKGSQPEGPLPLHPPVCKSPALLRVLRGPWPLCGASPGHLALSSVLCSLLCWTLPRAETVGQVRPAWPSLFPGPPRPLC